jgi:putative transposase
MPYDPEIHHRRSIRLRGYDYAQEGAYFITLCTHERECLFGEIHDSVVNLNPIGEIALHELLQLPEIHPYLELDYFVIMPNHIHAILVIDSKNSAHATIGEIIRRYKIYSAKAINKARDTVGATVWQHGFYEHIIRSEAMLNATREDIEANPAKWSEDAENPALLGRKD